MATSFLKVFALLATMILCSVAPAVPAKTTRSVSATSSLHSSIGLLTRPMQRSSNPVIKSMGYGIEASNQVLSSMMASQRARTMSAASNIKVNSVGGSRAGSVAPQPGSRVGSVVVPQGNKAGSAIVPPGNKNGIGKFELAAGGLTAAALVGSIAATAVELQTTKEHAKLLEEYRESGSQQMKPNITITIKDEETGKTSKIVHDSNDDDDERYANARRSNQQEDESEE
ncbi:hypothetical protein MP638_004136 [Amoeboaphelidium occidentale]|nr:hypothetical protein MP638_004136 [Amoeboaphelidium occidentale]